MRKGAIFPYFASPFEVKKHFFCVLTTDSRNVLKVDTYIIKIIIKKKKCRYT